LIINSQLEHPRYTVAACPRPDPELPMPTDASEPQPDRHVSPYWFAPPEPTLTSTFEPSADAFAATASAGRLGKSTPCGRGPATALSKVALESRIRTWGRPPGLRTASTPASPLHPTRSRTRRSGADLEIRPTSAAATFISMGGQEGHCDSQPSRLGNAAVAGFTGDSRYRSAYRLAAARSRRSSGAVRRGP
jgi:hypothetical protein